MLSPDATGRTEAAAMSPGLVRTKQTSTGADSSLELELAHLREQNAALQTHVKQLESALRVVLLGAVRQHQLSLREQVEELEHELSDDEPSGADGAAALQHELGDARQQLQLLVDKEASLLSNLGLEQPVTGHGVEDDEEDGSYKPFGAAATAGRPRPPAVRARSPSEQLLSALRTLSDGPTYAAYEPASIAPEVAPDAAGATSSRPESPPAPLEATAEAEEEAVVDESGVVPPRPQAQPADAAGPSEKETRVQAAEARAREAEARARAAEGRAQAAESGLQAELERARAEREEAAVRAARLRRATSEARAAKREQMAKESEELRRRLGLPPLSASRQLLSSSALPIHKEC
jgi:hypothetical protein